MVKVSYFTLFVYQFPNEVDVENVIIRATKDTDERSRAEAAAALSRMRADRAAALARLLAMLNNPAETEYVKIFVVRALGDLGNEQALDTSSSFYPGEIKSAEFKNELHKKRKIDLLLIEKLPSKFITSDNVNEGEIVAAFNDIVKILKPTDIVDDPSKYKAEFLKQIGKAILPAEDKERFMVFLICKNYPHGMVKTRLYGLEDLVNPGIIGTGPLQKGVIWAIGRICTPRAAKILIQCLNHPRSDLITASFNTLVSMNFVSVQVLVPTLEDAKTPPVIRAAVAWVLGSMGEFLKGLKEIKSEGSPVQSGKS